MTRGEDPGFSVSGDGDGVRLNGVATFGSGRFQAPLISTVFAQELRAIRRTAGAGRQWGKKMWNFSGFSRGLEWSLKVWNSTKSCGASSFGLD